LNNLFFEIANFFSRDVMGAGFFLNKKLKVVKISIDKYLNNLIREEKYISLHDKINRMKK